MSPMAMHLADVEEIRENVNRYFSKLPNYTLDEFCIPVIQMKIPAHFHSRWKTSLLKSFWCLAQDEGGDAERAPTSHTSYPNKQWATIVLVMISYQRQCQKHLHCT